MSQCESVVPVAEPMQHHIQPAAERSARQQQWGPFMLAVACPKGVPNAWTATCTLHKFGGRCNKSLSFANGSMTSDEARCRIKKWCLVGCDIPDNAGAREEHMSENPRKYAGEDVLSEAQYDQLVAAMEG